MSAEAAKGRDAELDFLTLWPEGAIRFDRRGVWVSTYAPDGRPEPSRGWGWQLLGSTEQEGREALRRMVADAHLRMVSGRQP